MRLRGRRARPRKKIEYAPVRDVTYLKPPGSCNTKWKTDTRSIDFQAECVEDSKIYVLDPCSQVSVAECKGCRVVIGPVSSSVFLIELTDCIVSVAAKQIRLRDCQRCELRVFCPNKEGLIIETSDSLTIGAWDVSIRSWAPSAPPRASAWADPTIGTWCMTSLPILATRRSLTTR